MKGEGAIEASDWKPVNLLMFTGPVSLEVREVAASEPIWDWDRVVGSRAYQGYEFKVIWGGGEKAMLLSDVYPPKHLDWVTVRERLRLALDLVWVRSAGQEKEEIGKQRALLTFP